MLRAGHAQHWLAWQGLMFCMGSEAQVYIPANLQFKNGMFTDDSWMRVLTVTALDLRFLTSLKAYFRKP